ncbi:MAG TPA: hypothetical protein VL945_02215 [Candidatus Saccharimonadales bacterium]|nr:hypothetical protein [Candidatus Saccharimonadales bacterium]
MAGSAVRQLALAEGQYSNLHVAVAMGLDGKEIIAASNRQTPLPKNFHAEMEAFRRAEESDNPAKEIAMIGRSKSKDDLTATPCGVCLDMAEYHRTWLRKKGYLSESSDLVFILINNIGNRVHVTTLEKLLPTKIFKEFDPASIESDELARFSRLKEMAEKSMSGEDSRYERFAVGAALVTLDGEMIPGRKLTTKTDGLPLPAAATALIEAANREQRLGDTLVIVTKGRQENHGPAFPSGTIREMISDAEYLATIKKGSPVKTKVYIVSSESGRAVWAYAKELCPCPIHSVDLGGVPHF